MSQPILGSNFFPTPLLAQGTERLSDPGLSQTIVTCLSVPVTVKLNLNYAHGKNSSTNGKICIWAANFIWNQAG